MKNDDPNIEHLAKRGDAETSTRRVSTTLIEFLLRIGDMIAIYAAGVAMIIVMAETIPAESRYLYVNLAAITIVLAQLCTQVVGGYDSQAWFSLRQNLQTAFTGWLLTLLLLLVAGFAFKATDTYSRFWITGWVGLALGLSFSFRILIGLFAKKMRKKHNFDSRTVIIGAGQQGRQLASFLMSQTDLTIQVIGFIDERGERIPDELLERPLLGDLEKLDEMIKAGEVDQVMISLPWAAKDRLREIIEVVSINPVKVRLAPDLAAFDYLNRSFTFLGGLPVMNLFDRPISGIDHYLKIVEDYIFAAAALLLLSPIMIIVAGCIKFDSKGPVFFRQKREGFSNREFQVWKFRSMTVASCEDDDITQAAADDARITKVGAFIRKTSLDELPQLFNVLTGDMSLVGPRPHAPSTKAGGIQFGKAVDRYAARHRVKPGITGWAQVNGWRGETDTVEKLEQRIFHDLYYIDNWSLWLDIKILARTALVAWSQKTAY